MRSSNPSVRSKVIGTFTVVVLIVAFFGGLLFGQVRAQDAGQPAAEAKGGAQFEPASVAVAPRSNCILHPEGNKDPKETLHVNADEDGVVRFLALRPTAPNSVEKLALECTDANKQAKTYSVDLRSEETFKLRPFDPSQTTLRVRPALSDDPSRVTQEELLKAGYGLRPNATANPDVYEKWLTAARKPMHLLRMDQTLAPLAISHRLKRVEQGTSKKDRHVVQKIKSTRANGGWTGPILTGSFKKGATAADTTVYFSIIAYLHVPNLTPGPSANATIWVGLDNVFQTILDVNQTPTIANFGIHRQDFTPHGKQGDEAGARFSPKPGDLLVLYVWYCDSAGRPKIDGGYACSMMIDDDQRTTWECDQADSLDCPSYKLDRGQVGNGKLGQTAEFIIENDSVSQQWPIFTPVVMNGTAGVIKGNEQIGTSVGTTTDPLVQLWTDGFDSTWHVHITLSPSTALWEQVECSANDKWDGDKGECVAKH